MKKNPTTLTELQKVEQWLEEKACEQVELRSDVKRHFDMSVMARITDNAVKITLAEKWLAEYRVATPRMAS